MDNIKATLGTAISFSPRGTGGCSISSAGVGYPRPSHDAVSRPPHHQV